MAKAEDGAEVPVTLLYGKDTPLDGTAPCLLYGIRLLRDLHSGEFFHHMRCRWSIAASSTPSRIFVAARTRGSRGTRTGGASTS